MSDHPLCLECGSTNGQHLNGSPCFERVLAGLGPNHKISGPYGSSGAAETHRHHLERTGMKASSAFETEFQRLRNTELEEYRRLRAELEVERDTLRAELEALRAENAELKAKFSETKTTCAYCLATREAPCSPEDVQAHIEECPKHPLKFARAEVERLTKENAEARRMAEALVGSWDLLGKLYVPNYISIKLDAEGGARWELFCIRPEGKTPHELRISAEAERDALRARVQKLEGALVAMQDALKYDLTNASKTELANMSRAALESGEDREPSPMPECGAKYHAKSKIQTCERAKGHDGHHRHHEHWWDPSQSIPEPAPKTFTVEQVLAAWDSMARDNPHLGKAWRDAFRRALGLKDGEG